MIGDINLFLNDQDDPHSGEIEIMIAESSARRQGFGVETLCTFFRYGNFDNAYILLSETQLASF